MIPTQSFKLPTEFEGFVSNADSLLQQFQRLEVEDAVTISIYPDQLYGSQISQINSKSISDALTVLDSLTAFIDELSKTYIWFKDSIKLLLIIPSDKNDQLYFRSTIKFSDSIEDEWFITYIAFKVTEKFSEISISVTDADGQFLLIEAADLIPDWIDPENCDNRLWIRQGKLHIVSMDEAGRNIHDSGIKLTAALEAIQNRPADTIASRKVQEAIEDRTINVYPSKAITDTHKVHCTVSQTVATILQASPSLISVAINAFCLPSSSGSNKNFIAALQRFGPGLTDLVTISISLTRLQYAKMMYQTFHTPKKFHAAMQKVSQVESTKLNKSFELGCRLTCGLESAYQRSKKESPLEWESTVSAYFGGVDSFIQTVLDRGDKGLKKYTQNDAKKSSEYSELVKQYSDIFRSHSCESLVLKELYSDVKKGKSFLLMC
jgi:hypothetical protein